MIVSPGPALLVIPIGLSILATEFIWAKRMEEKLHEKIKKVKNNIKDFRLTSEQ